MKATVDLETQEDVLDTLNSLVSRNVRFVRRHGPIDLFNGRFKYRLEKPDKCGAEKWETLEQLLDPERHPEQPILAECEEWGTVLCGLLIGTGRDPKARIRLIQIYTTAHVQVVSKGKVLDPSVRLGMEVPKELRGKIYDLNFRGIS